MILCLFVSYVCYSLQFNLLVVGSICTALKWLDLSNVAINNQCMKEIGLKCNEIEVSLDLMTSVELHWNFCLVSCIAKEQGNYDSAAYLGP